MRKLDSTVAGGWRYKIKTRGDTSVLGWQVSALSVGKEAGFHIKSKTWKLAGEFLDHAVSDDGIYFGYQGRPQASRGFTATSVVGMHARHELGLDKSDTKFLASTKLVLEKGFSPEFKDPYYLYYATRLMKIQGGEDWNKWNASLTSTLLKLQSQQKFEAGSWWNDDKGYVEQTGGRFMTTIFALLCLME